ncbi:MAG: hypothetical protein PHH82_04375 [Candidatus ainarchaeum sp.]|nr:hypothetical protein [Candidatus ainarchaeum sp.]
MTLDLKIKNKSNREKILQDIKQDLLTDLKDQILSATVYGSTLNEDFCIKSDFDILLVIKKPDISLLKKLKKIKKKYAEKGVITDINVHSCDDVPAIRKEVFWHNNRGLYMQKEIELYGNQLIGENYFKSTKFSKSEIIIEAVRVINSLNYQARKLLINKNLDQDGRILMMKWCIYGALYALATKEIYPLDKKTALKAFYDIFEPPINPEKFLQIKVNRPINITDEDVEVAYEFLTYLDKRIFQDYIAFKKRSKTNGF